MSVGRRALAGTVVGLLVGSGAMILMDGQEPSLVGWLSYVLVLGLCTGVSWLAWKAIGALRPPRWLALALLLAFCLRLGLALVFTHILPEIGSGRPHQEAGYFFPDAYDRDRIAWEFARSDRALWEISPRESRVDQYGGLLIWSAATYRALSPDAHRPLLIGLQAATVSSLGVLCVWAFVSAAFGTGAAVVAAWLAVIYPESILLGASQMREPFTTTALTLILLGYVLARRSGSARAWLVMLSGCGLAALISPPFAALGIGVVVLAWVWEEAEGRRMPGWAWIVLIAVAVAALAFTSHAWEGAGVWGANALDILRAWIERSASYEFHVLEEGSGMVQALFEQIPSWLQVPLATLYGLARPFLPAALFEPSAPLAQTVEIVRAVGWYGILPFLMYAPLAALRARGVRSLPFFLAVLVWVTAIAASYRGGADDWDNVRYRATFLALQLGLAGWAWAHVRATGSPWLRRVGGMLAGLVLLFVQWYAGRYAGTPALDIYATLVASGVFIFVVLVGAVALDRSRGRGLTRPPPGV